MKKIYITPETDTIELSLSSIVALSFGDGQVGDGELEEAAGEARNDWENIWGN